MTEPEAPVEFGWAFARERPWVVAKYLLLFVVLCGFVSWNFGGLLVGLPVATAVTLLSLTHWRIFDRASDAFLDVRDDDTAKAKTGKVAATAAKRICYSSLDYGLAILSILMVVGAKSAGFAYWFAVAAMWLVIDLPTSVIFVVIYERTGRDLTLGRSYRRMADVIMAHSKLAGVMVFAYETTLASFWSGPDYTVMFFRDELKTRLGMGIALLLITAAHALIWTTVYWFGYENVLELMRSL